MPIADFLTTIAQVAVSLAGFSGLIAAIRTAAPDGWHPRDIWSLSWMLGASIGALILALLPLYVGSLMALLVASVLVLAVFLVLLARIAHRKL